MNIQFAISLGRLAPLWPFLGFLGEAFFIVLIISTYEQAKHESETWSKEDNDYLR
jgi:hypothetical protein